MSYLCAGLNKSKMSYISSEKKQELFSTYGKSNSDSGSPESQIALFSHRINHLTGHLKENLITSGRCKWSKTFATQID